MEPICTCVVVGCNVVLSPSLSHSDWLICLLLIVCLSIIYYTSSSLLLFFFAFWCLFERAREGARGDSELAKGLTNGWGWRANAEDDAPGRRAKQNKKPKNEAKEKSADDQNAFPLMFIIIGGNADCGRRGSRKRERDMCVGGPGQVGRRVEWVFELSYVWDNPSIN